MTTSDIARAVPLVDHHCHGVVTAELDRPGLEAIISEGGAPPPGETNFDTPIGLAIRRHCAPVLGLQPHAGVEEYLERRFALGSAEVSRRFLATSGTSRYLVDTGHRSEGLTTPEQMAELTGTPTSHIVRLESVAESLAAEGVDADRFAAVFAERLAATTSQVGAVGVKSVAAYRTGLRLDAQRPSPTEVAGAVGRWLAAGAGRSGWRLADPVLQRLTLWTAVDLGLPIQFHIGFGDSDIRMTEVDPTLLTDWLQLHRIPVLLLHCWPRHREASYLACIYPHVHLDVGSVLHYVGAPELYLLGALNFRLALGAMLADRVDTGEWSLPDAERFAQLVGHANAERVYRLPRGGTS